MRQKAKKQNGGKATAKPAVVDEPAKVSTAAVVEPAAQRPEELPLLPPAVEQWLKRNGTAIAIGVFLVVATLAIYGQTFWFEFVSFDDNEYVYENYRVRQGFTPATLEWAFTGVHSANWHPLTTLSHVLDWTMFGPWAGGHHFINVLLHAASSVVLFIALRRLTGATWRSGLVAALFCLHPAHVESVAWVAERKDVLSGLFFGLTLWAYAAYAQSPFSWIKYLLLILVFALGLLSKPMLVTVPFLLLLLDFWPLGRWQAAASGEQGAMKSPWMLVLEKLPLVALSAASCVVTYKVQQSAGAMELAVTLSLRLQMVFLGYGRYLAMLLWPFGLAVPYPRDLEFYATATAISAAVLAAVSAAVLMAPAEDARVVRAIVKIAETGLGASSVNAPGEVSAFTN